MKKKYLSPEAEIEKFNLVRGDILTKSPDGWENDDTSEEVDF